MSCCPAALLLAACCDAATSATAVKMAETDVQQWQDWVCCGGVFWVVGGNTSHTLGVTEKILTHAEIKHYTYVGIHNKYTLASTVIGTIRYYKTQCNRKK
jgi:hypothetical protein